MRYQFIKFFFEAGANEGGGNPDPKPDPNADPAPDPKPDAALTAKIAELETKFAELLKPKPDPKPKPKKDEEIPEWAKTQNELIEKLVGTVTSLQAEKITGNRKTVFETAINEIEGLPDYYKDEVIESFEGRTFENDAAFEAFKKKKVEAATKVASDVLANSLNMFGAPGKSTGGNTGKAKTAADKDVINLVDSIM